jgi:hypothetical protein
MKEELSRWMCRATVWFVREICRSQWGPRVNHRSHFNERRDQNQGGIKSSGMGPETVWSVRGICSSRYSFIAVVGIVNVR